MNKNSDIVVYNYMDTFFCCHVEKDMLCEDMVDEHMLVYICSGEMELISPEKKYLLKKGDSFLVKRNHRLRKIKRPTKNGEPFKGLFLQLKAPFLKTLLSDSKIIVSPITTTTTRKSIYVMLEKHPFFEGLFTSLEQYFDAQEYPSKELMNSKLREAVFALLQLKPELGAVLFDFAEPWKINLEEFMLNNYKHDLSVEQFAHYTGRSLSSFKKDFDRIFHITPSRWLIKKRLEEAKLLMKQGMKPIEVYLLVGFKSLSHFSTAFKKEYGQSPSSIS